MRHEPLDRVDAEARLLRQDGLGVVEGAPGDVLLEAPAAAHDGGEELLPAPGPAQHG